MRYAVYWNRPNKKTTIHQSTCGRPAHRSAEIVGHKNGVIYPVELAKRYPHPGQSIT